MKLACLILIGIVSAAGLARAQAPPLLERYKCYICHADREAKTGPAFADVAARYKGKPQAVATLVATVKYGRHGAGPWQMPPHPEVSEADAKVMVRYILSLRVGVSRSESSSDAMPCLATPSEAMMYKHLFVAVDGSKLSAKAVMHAITLAKAIGAKLTAFYASPGYPAPVYAEGFAYSPMTRREYAALRAKEADKILVPVSVKAREAGLRFDAVHEIADAPWEAILAAARKGKCDAIVMASHGRRGMSALLLGSETQKVLTHSKLPVIVVR